MALNTSESPSPSSSQDTSPRPTGQRLINAVIAVVAVILGAALFLGIRSQPATATLATLAAESVPLETALSNGHPTLMEFYANWCTSCQAMAPDLTQLKADYGDRVNFVMLNVDNNKWLPEMVHYRVDGIPHFVFLDDSGDTIGMAIGEQPRLVLAQNLDALMTGSPLPYARSTGQTSAVEAPLKTTQGSTDPRSHGAQVVNP